MERGYGLSWVCKRQRLRLALGVSKHEAGFREGYRRFYTRLIARAGDWKTAEPHLLGGGHDDEGVVHTGPPTRQRIEYFYVQRLTSPISSASTKLAEQATECSPLHVFARDSLCEG